MSEQEDKKKITCPQCGGGELEFDFSDESVLASDDNEMECLELTCKNCHRKYVWI